MDNETNLKRSQHHLPSGVAHTPPLEPTRLTSRIGMLRPLQIRDFRLLWAGMTISFTGDGFYLVAIAWASYELSNVPTAFSLVSFAWSLPMVLFLLFGGVLSDRFDRRNVMIAGDVLRGVVIAAAGALAVTGTLEFWHLIVIAALYGIGQAVFNPAFGAIVPDVVPQELLVQANSLDQFVRNVAERLAGPALGGVTIAAFGGGIRGAGAAFLVDAGTFAFSALMLSLMTRRPVARRSESTPLKEIREGIRFARSQPWLWGTLAGVAVSLLFVIGPFEVLIPYLIKNKLGGGSEDVGYVFAAGGVGAIAAALFLSQRGLPRHHITFMFVSWAVAFALMIPYAVVNAVWQAAVIEAIAFALFTCGLVVWGTLMHRLVPKELLGRVTSLDWAVSTALLPVSFALTGPVAEWIGLEATFVWSGILGGIATLAFLLVPGIRDTEKNQALADTPLKEEDADLVSA
ncbi:MAG: MFS transporter [Actinobacteria bacterium]|nr:MFS transporter [Actinomycetota bacterium]